MLSAFLLLINSVLWMLRLGVSGSFPRPLKADEEREYLDRWINHSDVEARNTLIEHNLRLVAHIIKKGYPSRKLFWQTTGETRFDDYNRHTVVVWTVRM